MNSYELKRTHAAGFRINSMFISMFLQFSLFLKHHYLWNEFYLRLIDVLEIQHNVPGSLPQALGFSFAKFHKHFTFK